MTDLIIEHKEIFILRQIKQLKKDIELKTWSLNEDKEKLKFLKENLRNKKSLKND